MDFKDKVIRPFTPVQLEENDCLTVGVLGRKYTFDDYSMISSIITNGQEILNAPIKIYCEENGQEAEWLINERRLFSANDEQAIILGSLQSHQHVINLSYNIEYDGYCKVDLKIMTKGARVAEVFGLQGAKKQNLRLSKLWVEIPLKVANSKYYHFYPLSDIVREDGSIYKPMGYDSCSGEIENKAHYHLPNKLFMWLGDDERGIEIIMPSLENVEIADENRQMEIIERGNERVLRIRLLDNYPTKWKGKEDHYSMVFPICFSFGFQVTPIKTFPKNQFLHNALHIDCFKKIEGNYIDFFSKPVVEGTDEIGYDRLKRLGVTTLILHEKWNDLQNYPVLTKFTAKQLKTIICECHKREIKVMPYFGYEIPTLAPNFSEIYKEACITNSEGVIDGEWWRVPPQRDFCVCYNSSYADFFVENIKNLVETYHFDGVYLDGTIYGRECANELHGCGYLGIDGKRHNTYPIYGIRSVLKRLYAIFEPRGGIINYHSSALNCAAMGFTHLAWTGENIQFKLVKEGVTDLPLDYIRAEYTGRNFGIPMEMITYENRPVWNYEQAIALGLVHGILPRPNDIGKPLEDMSKIWGIINNFPIELSKWVTYWHNDGLKFDDDNIKCSYYVYNSLSNKKCVLMFTANLSKNENVVVDNHFDNYISTVLNGTTKVQENKIIYDKFSYAIIYLEEK